MRSSFNPVVAVKRQGTRGVWAEGHLVEVGQEFAQQR